MCLPLDSGNVLSVSNTHRFKEPHMSGLTSALSAHLRTLAGPDFTYPGIGGCGRPSTRNGKNPGSPRRGLRAWLHAAQGGLCCYCGEGVALDAAEYCHVAARGPMVRGFLPGNVFAGHAACNAASAPEWADGVLVKGVDVLGPEHLRRADLVPTEWPHATVGAFHVYDN